MGYRRNGADASPVTGLVHGGPARSERLKAKPVVQGLYMVPLGGVNAFLLDAPEGLVLIDAGFPDKADAILAAMADLGRAPGHLRHIVLTHAHPDHIGSLAALVRATGAETWMHRLDAPIAERGAGFRPLKPAPNPLLRLLFHMLIRIDVKVEPATIDHLIEDGDVIPLAGGLRAVHAPGHCAGQVALLWQTRGVLFAADVCTHLAGLTDPIGFEDQEEGRRSQRKLAGLDFTVACFGHGKAITHDAARRCRAKWPAVPA